MSSTLKKTSFFKFIVVSMTLVLAMTTIFSNVIQAKEVDPEDYEKLGLTILKSYDYDSETNEYNFDSEEAKAQTGLSNQQIQNVEDHLATLSPEHLQLLQDAKTQSEGPQTRALPLLPIIGGAAIGIVAAVGTEVASNFAEDIYNYGLTKACQNFDNYSAIKDFCVINDYI